MEVVCPAPLRASAFVWQPRPGAFALTVVCKATFSLAPGQSPLLADAPDLVAEDVHHEEDPRRSLRLASDLAPLKRRADVLVTGHAHAPGGRPVPVLAARLAFQEIDKVLSVVGDAYLSLDNRFSEPAPWSKMPLVWERAAVADALNPVGVRMGREARADAWGRVLLPNLRPADAQLSSRWDVFAPAGFGPLSPDWPARAARLPALAKGLDPRLARHWPLADDFDMAFFNAAPPGQTVDRIAGDEELVLENLLPHTPMLKTRLAPLVPVAHLDTGGGPAPLALRCDTLVIDTDLGTASLSWRGHAVIDHPERAGRVVVSPQALPSQIAVPAAPGTPPSPAMPTLPTPPSAPVPAAASVRETVGLRGALPGFVLPFREAGKGETPASPGPPQPDPQAAAPDAPPDEAAADEPVFPEAHRKTVDLASWIRPVSGDSSLPFRSAAAPPSTPAAGDTDRAAPLPEQYPIDRCARIAARLACRPEDEADILRDEQLEQSAFRILSGHWLSAIRVETSRGKRRLLFAYDAAYVRELEVERGPIEAADYARLALAAERRETASVLAALSLPEAALPRIGRVWLRKIVDDPAVAEQVRAAVRALEED